jgi:type I restriction enzyme S subunit
MINGLRPYPAYKDSGGSWLPKIPTDWEMRRNGRLFALRKETGYPDLPILEVSLKTGVRVRNLDGSERKQMMSDRAKYQRARQGDLAYNMMRMWQGAVGVAPVDGLVSPAYVVASPYPEALAAYYAQVFRTADYMREVDNYSRGIVRDRNRLYWDGFKQIPSPYPPHTTQIAILRFLDHADRLIRRYIRAKKKLIALLNEQKQAIVHQAVTRGLNHNVKLKPSGVDWLGDVPKHWTVSPFKTKVAFQEGPGIMRADFRLSGIPLLRISCLLSKTDPLEGCNFLDPAMVQKRWSHFSVQRGDYLLSASTSASTITVCPAADAMMGTIPYTGIIRLWPRQDDANIEYISYVIRSILIQEQLIMMRSGVGIAHFGPSHLSKLFICLPPLEEQNQILGHLQTSCVSIDRLEARVLQQISSMQTFRARLIADVVTGKLDVRDAAKCLPDETEGPEEIEDIAEPDEGIEGDDVEEAVAEAEP